MPLHPLREEWDAGLRGGDPLAWPGYVAPEPESVLTGRTDHYVLIEGRFDVLGGSMGAVHGEKVVRAFRRATDLRLPVVVVTASGGARMQEGMVSLVQMARTASAAEAHAVAGLLSVGVFTSPTTGGVYASYGSLCAVRAATPGATVGFAGPRVVALTTGVALPPGSHTAERAYECGLVDALVDTADHAVWVERVLGIDPPSGRHRVELPATAGSVTGNAAGEGVPAEAVSADANPATGAAGDGAAGEESAASAVDSSDAWDAVNRARLGPGGVAWANAVLAGWVDLRSADPVVRAGLAWLGDQRVVAIAHDRTAAEGRPGPDGLRLAQRAVALAARLGLPVVTFIDTAGAEPGAGAEADGIAGEIARTFAAMAALPVPTVAVCVGEGGSGGALSFGHADRLLILDTAVFSVISPEGAAAILERDADHAPTMAGRLKLTPSDLLELGIVDAVVPAEPGPLQSAIADALAGAEIGGRDRRIDAATARWLR